MTRFLRQLKSIQQWLFALLIFTIPTNLFFKFFEDRAYVHGLLVDYVLPKLYISDLVVIALLICWCVEWVSKKKRQTSTTVMSLMVLFAAFSIVQISSTQTAYIIAVYTGLLSVFKTVLVVAWILKHKQLVVAPITIVSLLATVVFQLFLAGYQYLAQRPLFGYLFFGEPELDRTATIVKSTLSEAVRVLPYGTTPHPNILAGILTIFVLLALWFIFRTTALRTLKQQTAHTLASISMVLVLPVFTLSGIAESGTALASMVLGTGGLFLLRVRDQFPSVKLKKILLLLAFAVLFIPVIGVWKSTNSDPSLLRRRELLRIAVDMIRANPLTGAGLNQFTAIMEQFGTVSGNLRFLQPVHNTPLLWVAETGVAGIVFLTIFVYFVHKKYSLNLSLVAVVGIPWMLIFSLDHYAISLQQGQLMFGVIVGFLMEKRPLLH